MAVPVERWLLDDLREDAQAAPHAIRLKLDKLARDPFAFFRGTLPEYVRVLSRERRNTLSSARGLVTGDLHLENFGTYLGEHGEVAFDLNDFDEVTLAPLVIDLRRLAASAALVLGSDSGALAVLHGLHHGLELALDAELEAPPAVQRLIAESERAARSAFLAESTILDGRGLRLRLGPTLHAPNQALAPQLESGLRGLRPKRSPRVFALLDAARRLAGNGSLGRRRYLALVDGLAESPVILDLKEPRRSPWGHVTSLLGERQRARQVERAARALRPTSEQILGTALVGGRLFQVREHSPHGMKLAALALEAPALLAYARYTGALAARGWRRAGAPVDELAHALESGGEKQLIALAVGDAERTRDDYARFMKHRESIVRKLELAS